MKIEWSQIQARERLGLVGLGILLIGIALHVFWWDPVLQEIGALEATVVQQEQETQGLVHKIGKIKDIEQQLARIRGNIQSLYQEVWGDRHSSTFRKDVMELANETGMLLRVWKLEEVMTNKEQTHHFLSVRIKVEGGFQQAVQFVNGMEKLPWVRSITSLEIVRATRAVGQVSSVLEMTIQGINPADLEQMRRLLTT